MIQDTKQITIGNWILYRISGPIFQGELVGKCFSDGIFSTDDISNYENCILNMDFTYWSSGESDDKTEIYDWIIFPFITEYFVDELATSGHPVLTNEYGTWIGRTDNLCGCLDNEFIPYLISTAYNITFTSEDLQEFRVYEDDDNFVKVFERNI